MPAPPPESDPATVSTRGRLTACVMSERNLHARLVNPSSPGSRENRVPSSEENGNAQATGLLPSLV